ncbi:TonB-dependent receptor [Segetibacter sp. 3557_3]|uniref:TonB-dependent receptor n=1 Tax=Segetibacter sp. 3557_3 TaxID=2547429 RepID=UPI0010587005|nr:TonB-dependent receptor [Segetibacter sp. 3557_3]TDH21279.1 TonB-dependent receptor [Segetibacter sp. 3557_3]
MIRKTLLAFSLILLCTIIAFGQKHTISGYVSDKNTGERLRGASVLVANKTVGTTTNNFGFYSITLPQDSITLLISYAGFTMFEKRLLLNQDVSIDAEMEVLNTLDEVMVKSYKKTAIQNATQMSSIDLSIETIKSLPKFLGETDIIKAIQLLPGVQAGNEGQSGIYVRGGGPDQNLILLDGVPVYNVSHMFGFFSVFNADAVKSVELIKGGFPARYGGRLSSVLDIQMKEGNNKELHGEGGIGLIASRLTLEGPFKKGKESSFIVSGRRTYIDILAKPIIKAQTDGVNTGYYFYDLNAKANLKVSNKDHIYLSGYFGNDRFYAKETTGGYTTNAGLIWGNITAVARWNHLFNKKLFGNLTAHYSRYRFDITNEEKSQNSADFFKLRYFSGIEDVSAHYDIDYLPGPAHFIKMGTGITHHQYKPGAVQAKEAFPGGIGLDTLIRYDFVTAKETDTYIEDDIRLSSKLKANLGLHFTTFSIRQKTFTSLQPRVALRYLLNNDLSVKASYAQMNQYIHLLTNSGIGLPTDLWVPVTDKVPPLQSQQWATGLAYNYENKYEVSVEGYYKKMNNIIEYAEGASYLDVSGKWDEKVVAGQGWSYGGEFFVQRKKGKTTGLLGYTLSWTNRQFAAINFGNRFPYRYDRRHDLKTAIVHQVSKRFEVSAEWVYGTGQAITLPVEKYIDVNGREIQVYKQRNGFRLAPNHRLDVAATFTKVKKRYTRSWVLSVYNVYNRKNPFYIYLDSESAPPYKPVFKQISLFPVLPSITYQFKF